MKRACLAPTRRSLFIALSDAAAPDSPSRLGFGDRLDQSQPTLRPTHLDWCAAWRASRASNPPRECECVGASLIARPANTSLMHVSAHPALRWQVF